MKESENIEQSEIRQMLIQGFIGLNDEYVEGIFVSGEM